MESPPRRSWLIESTRKSGRGVGSSPDPLVSAPQASSAYLTLPVRPHYANLLPSRLSGVVHQFRCPDLFHAIVDGWRRTARRSGGGFAESAIPSGLSPANCHIASKTSSGEVDHARRPYRRCVMRISRCPMFVAICVGETRIRPSIIARVWRSISNATAGTISAGPDAKRSGLC